LRFFETGMVLPSFPLHRCGGATPEG
jgi:hypothetical protein